MAKPEPRMSDKEFEMRVQTEGTWQAVASGERAETLLAMEARRARAAESLLRDALRGILDPFIAEDFPRGADGQINWAAFPVSFGYAQAYKTALEALGEPT